MSRVAYSNSPALGSRMAARLGDLRETGESRGGDSRHRGPSTPHRHVRRCSAQDDGSLVCELLRAAPLTGSVRISAGLPQQMYYGVGTHTCSSRTHAIFQTAVKFMSSEQQLRPAQDLAGKNKAHFPNESAEYRTARNALLVKEIEVRRAIEALAAERRALPAGGEVPEDFEFVGESGTVRLSELFEDKDTLMVYSLMFGPQRKAPCPMCTSYLTSWNGTAVNLRERVALVVTARSPIERLIEFKKQRGLSHLPFVSDQSGVYTRTYVNADDADVPGFTVFTKRDGKIHHFYSGEMGGDMADPGQDPRGAPDIDPLWLMLDLTPEGRGETWYPKLEYGSK